LKTYKAALFYGTKDVRIENFPFPELDSNQVLVRIKAANLCQSDVRKYFGLDERFVELQRPLILGHEGAGTVADVGNHVTKVGKGDPVALIPARWCRVCHYCRTGRLELCENKVSIGAVAGSQSQCVELLYDKGVGGTFAEFLKVDEEQVIKLPLDISLEAASLTEPLADVIKAQESPTEVEFGNVVVVFGLGPMGLLHVQVAEINGADPVIGIDPVKERRRKALELGAKEVIDPSVNDPTRKVMEITDGNGADIVIVSTGGRAQASCTEQAVEIAAKGGRINIFAGTYPPQKISIDPNLIHYRELVISASFAYRPAHFLKAISLIRKRQKTLEMVRHPILPLDQIREAFKAYGRPEALKIGINL